MPRVLIGLLICAALPVAALPPVEHENTRPLWVSRRPKPDGYFVGIGVAQKQESLPESKDRALKHALQNIATQIETQVLGEINMIVTEKAGEIQQEYRAEITTMVSATLEGVEIVDTWEDTENCWVYARLSALRFQRLRQRKIDNARRLAFEFFSSADEWGTDATAKALSLYVQALKPLRDALGDPLRVTHRGRAIALDTQIPRRIQAILSTIELEASLVAAPLKQGTAIDVPLEVTASVVDEKGTRHIVSGLPIRFVFERGRGDLVVSVWTGKEGTAISRLRTIHDPASVQAVQATIDLDAFSFRDARGLAPDQQPVRFAVPSATFQLEILRRTVHAVSGEFNLGHALAIPLLQPIVKGELGQAGLHFVDRSGQADLVLEIDARTRHGNRFQDIYFSFLDMVVSVRNRDSGDELFSASLTNIKGGGESYEQAGIKAFENAGEQLAEMVLPNMLDELNK